MKNELEMPFVASQVSEMRRSGNLLKQLTGTFKYLLLVPVQE